jgi:hypothetical protein
MRTATALRLPAAVLVLLTAATAFAQSEPFSWSTSFEDDTQAGFVNADWNTTAGTISMPPLVMTQVGSYSFAGGADRDVAVDGRVLHALDGRELFCLDGGRATQLPLLGRLYLGSGARAVAADDGRVVVAMGATGLRIVDAHNPAAPVLSGSLLLPAAVDVALTGRFAYAVDGVGSLHLISLANPAAPVLVESFALAGTPNRIARNGSVTVVGLGAAGFTVMTGQTSAMPWPAATVATASPVLAVAVLGNRAFVTTSAAQLLVYAIDNPASPQLVATLPTIDACTAVRADADFVYAAGATRLQRWHLPFGGAPQSAGEFRGGSAVRDLVVSGRHAFLAGNSVLAVELVVPASFTRTSTLALPGTAIHDLYQCGDLLAVGTNSGGQLVNVADPAAPFVVSSFGSGAMAAVDLTGDRLVYLSGAAGMVVMDVTNAAAPSTMGLVGSVVAGKLAVDDWRALTSLGGLKLWDLEDPYGTIPQVGSLTISTGFTDVTSLDLRGDRACVGTVGHVHVYDVADPAAPSVIASFPTVDAVRNVVIVGDRVVATDDGLGLRVYDIGGPVPALLGTYPIPGAMFDLEVVGDRAVVEAYNLNSLYVLDIGNPAAGIQLVQTFAVGSGSTTRLAFGTTQAWLKRSGSQLEGRLLASHAWQPEYNFAEILPQSHAGLIGFRTTASYTGDPDAITWTFIGDGAFWDLQPAADGTPTPWQYDDDGTPGWWNWNLALALGADGAPPVIHDLAFEFLFERPVITAVTDVPNDQGGQLRLQWRRSGYDRAGSPQPLLGYALYRLVDPLLGAKALNPPSPEEAKSLPPGDWDYLGLYAADGEDKYSVIVPSLADASVEGGDYATTYLVRARTTTVGLNHDSLVLSGVSVDNLAPNAPQQLTVAYAGGGNGLAWLASPEADLRYYNVYRGDHAGFVPGPASLVRQQIGLTWQDAAPEPFAAHYKVTAVDFAGNESEAALPAVVADAPGLPAVRFGLAPNVPNPFNPRTVIGFSLERAGTARLRIHDAAGRLVRTLRDGGMLPAGRHEVAWEGLDDAGRPVAAGVYHCRLESGGQVATRRLTLVK